MNGTQTPKEGQKGIKEEMLEKIRKGLRKKNQLSKTLLEIKVGGIFKRVGL